MNFFRKTPRTKSAEVSTKPIASEEDVRYCFRLLLGRPPTETDWELHHWRIGQDLTTVVKSYLNSLEFANRGLLDAPPGEYEVFKLPQFLIYLSRNDLAVGSHIANTGTYEPHVSRVFNNYLRPGMSVLDVGANIGYFSLLAASIVGASGKVVSVEPNPRNAKALHASAELNGFRQITVVQAAAGPGWNMLFLTPDYSNGVVSPLGGSVGDMLARDTVSSCPLDAIVGNAKIDLIKIDVEGFEFKALQGASGLIRNHHPVIITEFTPGALPGISGVNGTEYLDFFIRDGYKISVLTEAGPIKYGADVSAVMKHFEAARTHHIDLLCEM